MTDLRAAVKNDLTGKRVLIVGDPVADQYLSGTISRVSREAPVFILRHENTVTLPGGAANAAVNVASLGGTPTLIGLVGNDANGKLLLDTLGELGVAIDGLVRDDSVTTTTKVRVSAGQDHAARQQVIRIDYENPTSASGELEDRILAKIETAASNADCIVVSDYGCGSVTRRIFEAARQAAADNGIPLVLDSRHRLADFTGAASATPNREEVEMILGRGFKESDCVALRERLGCEALLVTNGNEGMLLIENDKEPLKLDAVGSKEPVDVTGAGDTVIAAYSLALASRFSYSDAARIANHAGGIVVMKKGTAAVTSKELCDSLATEGASHATAN